MEQPARGDVWLVDLNPIRGREQSGQRPAMVISVDLFNSGPADLIVVLPITSQAKGIPFHVQIDPSEGGVTKTSFIKCEDVRSISKERLIRRFRSVSERQSTPFKTSCASCSICKTFLSAWTSPPYPRRISCRIYLLQTGSIIPKRRHSGKLLRRRFPGSKDVPGHD